MNAREGIADGLRVVEIGPSVSVALAGMTLADAGAEVIALEPPGGSALRRERAFAMWARGKQSESVDLASAGGRARLDALLADADVLLLGLKAGSLERLSLIPESLVASTPQLVVACVTGFGRGGPFRDVPAWDGVVQARGGRMYEFSTMLGGERPVFAAAPVATYGAAMALLTGVFSALRERLRNGGRGQVVETSLIRALTSYDLGGWIPGGPPPLRLEDAPFLPYSIARTKDGVWIQFAQNGPALFADFLRVLGLEGQIDYLESMSPATDSAKKRGHRERIQTRIGEQTWAEWRARFGAERNLSAEPFLPPGGALDHPQFQAIGDVVELPGPDGHSTRQLGPVFDVPSRPLEPRGPAPRLGVGPSRFSSNDKESRHRATPEATRAPGTGLLSGVTVIELGMWIALPYAASQLAELGARVIKLEPLEGDPMRATGPFSYKLVQGKQSLALDMKQPEAQEIVHRLVARADALLHSYRPGVPERLGIDFETLRAINPGIVHLYNGAYGSRGPKCDAPAFHVTGGAVAGGAWAQAGAGCPPAADVVPDAAERARLSRRLELANEANPDFNSAVTAAAATAAGLYHRERTGEAIAIETRMMLSNAMMMSADFVDDGRGGSRRGGREVDEGLHGLGPLYRLYPTSKGWIFLAAPRARDFERLCQALGLDSLARDARFATEEGRSANANPLAEALGAAFAKRSADDLEASLTALGVACVRADLGPCRRWLFEQDWARADGLVVEAASSEVGPYLRYGAPIVNDRPASLGGAFPAGQDTRLLLAELGYGEREIASLLERRIVAGPTTGGARRG